MVQLIVCKNFDTVEPKLIQVLIENLQSEGVPFNLHHGPCGQLLDCSILKKSIDANDLTHSFQALGCEFEIKQHYSHVVYVVPDVVDLISRQHCDHVIYDLDLDSYALRVVVLPVRVRSSLDIHCPLLYHTHCARNGERFLIHSKQSLICVLTRERGRIYRANPVLNRAAIDLHRLPIIPAQDQWVFADLVFKDKVGIEE
jgi:hypothetical protein